MKKILLLFICLIMNNLYYFNEPNFDYLKETSRIKIQSCPVQNNINRDDSVNKNKDYEIMPIIDCPLGCWGS